MFSTGMNKVSLIKNKMRTHIKKIKIRDFRLCYSNFITNNIHENFESEKPKLKIINTLIKPSKINENENTNNKIPNISNNIVNNYLPQRDIPFFTIKSTSFKMRPANTTPSIKTKELSYSSYKLNDACKLIRGKYIRNAIQILEHTHTKGARIIREELESYLARQEKKREKKVAFVEKKRKLKEIEEYKAIDSEEKVSEESEIKNEDQEEETTSEKKITSSQKEILDYVPYEDFKIVEAYVGRKIGQSIPSPRAKGRTDLIQRSISRLFIHIEKVKAEEFFEQIAMGKADITFALNIRKSLFMSGAPLSTIRNFSFITTSKGRLYRKNQFERLIVFLRNKYYKEKGIRLNSEVVRNYLKSKLGKELAKINPINYTNILQASAANDVISQIYDKAAMARLREMGKDKDKEEKVEDRSLKAREKNFNKNFTKI